jgi:hypothetical protein
MEIAIHIKLLNIILTDKNKSGFRVQDPISVLMYFIFIYFIRWYIYIKLNEAK